MWVIQQLGLGGLDIELIRRKVGKDKVEGRFGHGARVCDGQGQGQ